MVVNLGKKYPLKRVGLSKRGPLGGGGGRWWVEFGIAYVLMKTRNDMPLYDSQFPQKGTSPQKNQSSGSTKRTLKP